MLYPFFYNNYTNPNRAENWSKSCKSESSLRQPKNGVAIYYSPLPTSNKSL